MRLTKNGPNLTNKTLSLTNFKLTGKRHYTQILMTLINPLNFFEKFSTFLDLYKPLKKLPKSKLKFSSKSWIPAITSLKNSIYEALIKFYEYHNFIFVALRSSFTNILLYREVCSNILRNTYLIKSFLDKRNFFEPNL